MEKLVGCTRVVPTPRVRLAVTARPAAHLLSTLEDIDPSGSATAHSTKLSLSLSLSAHLHFASHQVGWRMLTSSCTTLCVRQPRPREAHQRPTCKPFGHAIACLWSVENGKFELNSSTTNPSHQSTRQSPTTPKSFHNHYPILLSTHHSITIPIFPSIIFHLILPFPLLPSPPHPLSPPSHTHTAHLLQHIPSPNLSNFFLHGI